jgi:hypothetical protein
LLSDKPKTSRDLKNSRRLSFYTFLNTATKHNNLDSRSHDLAESNVGAASAANARSGNSEPKQAKLKPTDAVQ